MDDFKGIAALTFMNETSVDEDVFVGDGFEFVVEQLDVLSVEHDLDRFFGECVVLALSEQEAVGLGLNSAHIPVGKLLIILDAIDVLGAEEVPQGYKKEYITLEVSEDIWDKVVMVLRTDIDFGPVAEGVPAFSEDEVDEFFEEVFVEGFDFGVFGFVDVEFGVDNQVVETSDH